MEKHVFDKIINILQKNFGMDNITIIYNKEMIIYGQGTFADDTYEWLPNNPKEYRQNPRTDLDRFEMSILYDGGFMYSAMNGEFGWETYNNFIEELREILLENKLWFDFVDHITIAIYKDE